LGEKDETRDVLDAIDFSMFEKELDFTGRQSGGLQGGGANTF